MNRHSPSTPITMPREFSTPLAFSPRNEMKKLGSNSKSSGSGWRPAGSGLPGDASICAPMISLRQSRDWRRWNRTPHCPRSRCIWGWRTCRRDNTSGHSNVSNGLPGTILATRKCITGWARLLSCRPHGRRESRIQALPGLAGKPANRGRGWPRLQGGFEHTAYRPGPSHLPAYRRPQRLAPAHFIGADYTPSAALSPMQSSSLQRGVKLDPESFKAWNSLGLSLFRLKRYQEALSPRARRPP